MCPHKSPNYFVAHEPHPLWEGPKLRAMARQWISTRDAYAALFAKVTTERAIGEVSPVYLQSINAPKNIHQLCPDAKLIAILRQPVERAYAHYLGRVRDGLDARASFADVVTQELAQPLPDEITFGNYLGCGRYAHFLKGYFELFPRENIRVYLFQDLQHNPARLLSDLFQFLGVDPAFVPDIEQQHNRTGMIANPVLRTIWTSSVRVRTLLRPYLPPALRNAAAPLFFTQLSKPPLSPTLHAQLNELFRDDIAELEILIGRNLQHWLA